MQSPSSRERFADGAFSPAPLPQAKLDDRQRIACLRLIRSDNVGPVTFRELINHFGGAQAALEALPELSRRSRGKPIRICTLDRAEAELEAARRIGSVPLFTIEPGYPAALAHEPIPPMLLYVKGQASLLNRPALAIVGSRNSSAVGMTLARRLAGELGQAGYVVVSGLARGIDGAAHEGALASGTIAVLAGGIDFLYPPEHHKLHAAIAEQGCLVTEQPPGFQPRAKDFPRRNRIISGLALGTVIVEAAHKSGSLITARMALEQGREVFAVPGHPLDPRAEGTNALIKSGATLITSVEHILEVIRPMTPKARGGHATAELPETSAEPAQATSRPDALLASAHVAAQVLQALGPAPVRQDDLARATGLSLGIVRAALLELALGGEIEHHGHQLVSRRQ